MSILFEGYSSQVARWPALGRHILAQYDEESIVVYQAYTAAIGQYAVTHRKLGGPGFSLNRMSWIKTNFLWMMYRSGWGTKAGQEAVLAIRMMRPAFDQILSLAVPSSFDWRHYTTREEWQRAVSASEVRLQWDPDHDPHGNKVERRAIQLGLRGDVFRQFAEAWIVDIEDISGMVAEERAHVGDPARLNTPREDIYAVAGKEIADRLGLSGVGHGATH